MDRYSLNISLLSKLIDFSIKEYTRIFGKVQYSIGKGIQISIYIYNIHSSQGGTKSHLKSPFPPEMTLLKSQQNFPSCLKPNFLFTPISNISFKKFSR